MTKQDKREELITKSTLKKGHGWTDALIRKFLPTPDETRPNPHYSSASEMQLFEVHRIRQIERTEEFRREMEKVEKRRAVAKRVTEERHAATLAKVAALPPPELPSRSPEELRNLAIHHYNDLCAAREHHEKFASTSDSAEFLERITVNFVRHELTDYEKSLQVLHGQVGASDARMEVAERILDAIAEAYPWLGHECDRQAMARWTDAATGWSNSY